VLWPQKNAVRILTKVSKLKIQESYGTTQNKIAEPGIGRHQDKTVGKKPNR
jgi:hypothetical protein